MKTGIQGIHKFMGRVRRDERGITGLETAIVLIAFVVVASVFAYAVITTGLFSSEKARSSAEAGIKQAKSSITPKGSTVLLQAQAYGKATSAVASLIDTTALFLTEGVAANDVIRNITQGTSGTVTSVTNDTTLVVGGLAAWVVDDVYEIDLAAVAEVEEIRFKIAPSAGALPINLASGTTSVTFSDSNNVNSATFDAVFPRDETPPVQMAANTIYWNHTWLVGTGPGIETGEVVEFVLDVRKLQIPLGANSSFKIEVTPQTGAVLAVTRTTPLELTKVMDLN